MSADARRLQELRNMYCSFPSNEAVKQHRMFWIAYYIISGDY